MQNFLSMGQCPRSPYWWVSGIDIESSEFPPRTETYNSIQYSNKKKAEKHKKHEHNNNNIVFCLKFFDFKGSNCMTLYHAPTISD